MTKAEARTMLDAAPCGDKPSAINPGITQADAVRIVMNAIGLEDAITSDPLNALLEKRVWQVFKNQKRPNYIK